MNEVHKGNSISNLLNLNQIWIPITLSRLLNAIRSTINTPNGIPCNAKSIRAVIDFTLLVKPPRALVPFNLLGQYCDSRVCGCASVFCVGVTEEYVSGFNMM